MTSTRRRATRLLTAMAMLLIGITASVPLPASAQSGKQIVITGRSGDRTFQIDVNMPGSDYRSERLGANNPQLCQQLCDVASVCRAWTFVKAGLQGPQAVCWLKNGVPRAIRDTNTISGVKLEARQPVAFGFDMPGNDYRSASIGAWADCQRICDQETPCKAWSWLGPNVQGPRAMCLLKNDVPARVARQNVASGVKAVSAAPAEQPGAGSAQTAASGPGSPQPEGSMQGSMQGTAQGSTSTAAQSGPVSAEPSAAEQAQSSATPPAQQAGEAASSSMSQQGSGQSSVPASAQQAGETASSTMQQRGSDQSGVSSSVQQTANEAAASAAQPTDGATPAMPLRGRAERRAALVAATQKGFQNGIDMPGKDYRNVALNEGANAPAACQSLCTQDAQCKAWTWVKAGIQGPKVMCWLKNAVPQGMSNPNTVSGLKAQ